MPFRWLLPAENVSCYEMLFFQNTLVQNVAHFGQAHSVAIIFTSKNTENSSLK